MGVNLKKLRERKEEADSKRGNVEYWQIPPGENLLYVAPPLPGDDLMFIETAVHYDVGPEKRMVICLDEERNPVLKDPRVKKLLAGRDKDISDGCAVCQRLDDGDSKAGRESQSRYYFAVVPLKYRKSSTKKWREADDADELRILACGYTIWGGITDAFINNGDISDPNAAILVVVSREGTGMKTKYTISVDANSVREGGIAMPKSVRALVTNAIQEGESGDLYRIVANSVRSSAEVAALVDGVELEDSDDDDDDKGKGGKSKKPDCFGLDWEDGDAECEKCPHAKPCEAECTPPGAGDGDDDDEGDDDACAGPDDEGDDDDEPVETLVKDCTVGLWYTEDTDEVIPLKFTGTSKKGKRVWGFFEDEGGERVRFNGDDTVFSIPEPEHADGDDDDAPDGPDEASDDDMKALDAAIDARKSKGKKSGGKKPGGKGKAKGRKKK